MTLTTNHTQNYLLTTIHYLLILLTTFPAAAFIHINPTRSTLTVSMNPHKRCYLSAVDAPAMILDSASVPPVPLGFVLISRGH